ncbi:hypothetical protein BG011_002882 [Mortierella polycephala]|uniref:DinB-like domain-containing protein n=1 Tax=Mortierella polycephala TaxID=41804 RepID=A0A9P6Q474_9FUNG|nr:hypothetical protein BG011_002882 [Mortierella polycephala]
MASSSSSATTRPMVTPPASTTNGGALTTAASSSDDARHIYTVAARSLGDCVDLLLSLKAAMNAEEQEEQRRTTNGTGANGCTGNAMRDIHHMSRSASQEAEQGQGQDDAQPVSAFVPPRAPIALPQPITPCKRSEMYTKPSVLACQGTIGKHVRHLHDHYRLLFETYPPNQGLSPVHEWTVDYDKRSREVPMETDLEYAISELERLQHILEQYNVTDSSTASPSQPIGRNLLQPVTLQATIDPSHPPVHFQTTFGRELWFCSLHAVHHFAMIKVICGEFGMPLTEGFGLAPSTIKNRLLSH